MGNAPAQYNLATLYVQRPDVLTTANRAKTDALALQWFRKSAANGHPAAMEYLADVYRYGKLGQRPNAKLAASWQEKADAAQEKELATQTPVALPQSAPDDTDTPAAKPATATSDTSQSNPYEAEYLR